MNFALKTLAAALLTFSFAQAAKASVQPVGTFVAQQCGAQQMPSSVQNNVQQICIGSLVVEPGQESPLAFSFEYADGTQRVFQLAQTANFMIALPNNQVKSLFQLVDANGLSHTMKVTRTGAGKIETVSGTLEGTQYFVSDFQPVFIIQ